MQTSAPIGAAIAPVVDTGQLAGAVTVVHREGLAAEWAAVGLRDREAALPMERDTLFRIASMSKPVTSVAALTLLEEGRFALEDPIARWAPEFAEMHVLRTPDAALGDTVPAERPITFEDLLTHRSGLTYGDFHRGPIAEAHAGLGGDIDSALTPDDWIARLADLPLVDQPGAGFHYGHSSDLLGLLIARMEGAPLGKVLARRIFEPLGMKDTGFIVPKDQRSRRAMMYGFDEAGQLSPRPQGSNNTFLAERPDEMSFVSGGQGLWSTADDYLTFARLFVGGGAVDGVRILSPETMALMTTNRLSDRQRAETLLLGMPPFAAHGFGLGVTTVLDPEKAAIIRCKGGVGTVGWPGAFGGWWQADPTNGKVMVFLAHNSFDLAQAMQGIGLGVYAAIERFHAAASVH